MAPDRLVVGVVVKPHGIRGELVVDVVTDIPGRFDPGATVRIGATGADLTVRAARAHQGRLLVTLDGVADRNAAEDLRGAELTIDAADAGELPEDTYYVFDLEGLEVVHADGTPLGTLARVEETPANDLWVVRSGGKDVLVPAVRAIVVDVDLAAGRVVLDPPEGLF